MNEKQLAERLRHIADAPALTLENRARLHAVADELNPPEPNPGAVVWYWIGDDDGPHLGVVDEYENHIVRTQWGGIADLNESKWKPARILGPRQVAVDVPHTNIWPLTVDGERATRADLVWHFIDPSGRCFNQQVAKHVSITRAEAERMEASDE